MLRNNDNEWTEEEDFVLLRSKKVALRPETIAGRLPNRSKDDCSTRNQKLERERRTNISLPAELVPQQQDRWKRRTDEGILALSNENKLYGGFLRVAAFDAGMRPEQDLVERCGFLKSLSPGDSSMLKQLQETAPRQAHSWYDKYRMDLAEEKHVQRLAIKLYREAHPEEDEESEGFQALMANLRQTASVSATRHWRFRN
jgi:hypothetical protein